MAKTRELPCIHYVCAHNCDVGKDAEFYGLCQTCPTYKARKGSAPARTDNRKKIMAKIRKKELRDVD